MPGSQRPASRRPLVVAIDGPSGSGKSTVSRLVAVRLGLEYLDTGAMYRAVCWAAWSGASTSPTRPLWPPLPVARLEMGTDPDAPFVRVDGRGSTRESGDTRVSAAVSAVATNLEVRAELRRRQHEIIDAARQAERGGVVAEGRDITTVVAPDADVRILLTAASGRAWRAGPSRCTARTTSRRSPRPTTRSSGGTQDDATVASFLEAADGVLHLDSSGLTLEETVDTVLRVVAEQAGLDWAVLVGKDLLVELDDEPVGAGRGA